MMLFIFCGEAVGSWGDEHPCIFDQIRGRRLTDLLATRRTTNQFLQSQSSQHGNIPSSAHRPLRPVRATLEAPC